MRTRIFFNHQTGERTVMSEEDMAKRYIQNGPTVIPDISGAYKEGGILSPIDGSFITSREQLRRHNITHNVRSGGDFKPGDLIRKEQRRVEINRQLAQRGKVDFAWK
jgi:hypothetical protein